MGLVLLIEFGGISPSLYMLLIGVIKMNNKEVCEMETKIVMVDIDSLNELANDEFIVNDWDSSELADVLVEKCGVTSEKVEETLDDLWDNQLHVNESILIQNVERFHNETISNVVPEDIRCDVTISSWGVVNGVKLMLEGTFYNVDELYANKQARELASLQ